MSLYDELLHVPWILKLPAGHAREAELALAHDKFARAIDVAPTVLDLLGLPELPEQSGTSLLEGTLRVLFAETHPPAAGDDLFGLRDEAFKLVLHAGAGPFELFDLALDPGETRDVFAERQGERAEWQQVLAGAARRWRELVPEAIPERVDR
jgi:arylsulfatase A-like enzyme